MKTFAILAGVLAVLLPEVTHALGPIYVVCKGLAGCGGGVGNVALFSSIPGLMSLMTSIAAGTSMVFIVYGGFQMTVFSWDEGRASKGKTSIMYALIGLMVTLASHTLVVVVSTEPYGGTPEIIMNSAIRILVTLFNVLFVIVIIVAGIRMGSSAAKTDEFRSGATMLRWAIIGAIVVNLSRGIAQVVLRLGL